jgi:mycothiol synthase
VTTLRPYAGPVDLPAILDLLIECEAAGYVDMELRSIELRIWLGNNARQLSNWTAIAEDGGSMLGFGLLWGGHTLGLLVHPSARRRLESRLIDWAAGQVRTQGLNRLGALCRDDDPVGLEVLRSLGFATVETELRMTRDLDAPLPEPTVPDGFSIRRLALPHELDEWLALYAATIGDRPHILGKWRAYRADIDYDNALDLVAVDSAGRLAGACTCTLASLEAQRLPVREGRTEPIMVRADCQGRGLGTSLVVTGLRALRQRGLRAAALTTEADNHRAHKLYAALGYHTSYQAVWMDRPC